jgi:ATP-dependent 26S proteasome regulatory subunit
MNDQHDLELMVTSRFPIILIETYEEPRVLELLERICNLRGLALFTWNISQGLQRNARTDRIPETKDPSAVLRHIESTPQNGVYTLLDFHPYLADPVNVRLLKNIAQTYHKTERTLVFVSHKISLPPELERMAARFSLSIPDMTGIRDILRDEIAAWERFNEKVRGHQEAVDSLVLHLLGLTGEDARRLVRLALRDDGMITMSDIPRVLKAKHDLLAQGGLLNLELDTAQFSDVAGVKNLKRWLTQRRPAFLGAPEAAGLDAPKGIMLLGVQGCGKSLAAKAVAGTWGVPLLHLDFGSLYDKYIGETERNLRDALKTADAMAPCILWIDEIEKSLSTDSAESDGGSSQRLLSSLLTWMAERKSRVFIVATANDIQALPPELVRKGRLDEIFFVDLPDSETREEILRIHLKRRKQPPEHFDLQRLAHACDGFSGAEIEQAVVSALYEAVAQKQPLSNDMVLSEVARTRPLSVVMSEKLQALRHWATDRTVMAQ